MATGNPKVSMKSFISGVIECLPSGTTGSEGNSFNENYNTSIRDSSIEISNND